MNMWHQAEQMHKDAGLDYAEALSHYMHFGYMFTGPKFMIWAEPMDDSWFIWLAIGNKCIPKFINCMPFWLPKFSFCRFLRGRNEVTSYSLDKLCRLYGIPTEHIQSR